MATCVKRLRKEIDNLEKNPDDQIKLIVDPNDIKSWRAFLKAPQDSAYAGYFFEIAIDVGSNYPLTPPGMRFVTKIFHPNVLYSTGEICLDILKKEWSPAWSLQSACRAIIALLADPAPDSPLNCDAGNMLRAGDMTAFRSMVAMYCVEYAGQVEDWKF